MKSTKSFSFSKNPIGFKPTTCSATCRRISQTTNPPATSRYPFSFQNSRIPVGWQGFGCSLAGRQDLTLPWPEQPESCPSIAKTTGSQTVRIWPLPSQNGRLAWIWPHPARTARSQLAGQDLALPRPSGQIPTYWPGKRAQKFPKPAY